MGGSEDAGRLSDAPATRSFAFGPYVLIPGRQLLLRDGVAVRIGGRALDILTVLVERPGEVIGKRDLIARVWPGLQVEDGNLKVNMAVLRRVLEAGPDGAPDIATVVGRGYRFAAPIRHSPFHGRPGDEPTAAPRPHNLASSATRIIGRDDVLDGLPDTLSTCRLVSVVGPGGVGKTTVALAVAQRAAAGHRDGVWLVDLAPPRGRLRRQRHRHGHRVDRAFRQFGRGAGWLAPPAPRPPRPRQL